MAARSPQEPGRNIDSDQEWLDAEHAAGRIKVIEDDLDVPIGVRLQWTGKTRDKGSPYLIPDAANRCSGRAFVRDDQGCKIIDAKGRFLTRQCLRWRTEGLTVCATHGPGVGSGKIAAQRILDEMAHMAALYLHNMAFKKKMADGDRIRALNSILDRVGVRGGTEVVVSTPHWQEMLREMFESGDTDFPEPEQAAETAPAPRPRRPPRSGSGVTGRGQ